MSAAPTETGVGGLFDNIVGAVTSIASGGDPVSAAASLVPAVSLSVSPQATPSPNQTWQRWQQIHPGTPRSDYDNWWSQYGQSGGTINGAGVGDALLDALNMASSRDYTVNRGDSPASIAKKFGVSLDQLLNANPQKATTMVRGVRTWTDLSINEGLNLPKTDSAGVGFNFGHFLKSLANPLTVLDPRNLDPRHLAQTTFGGDSRKPTAMSSWQRWQKIHPHSPYSNYKRWWDTYGKKGGTINGAPGVGDYTVDAVREVAAIDPCDRANVDRVCAAQAAMGFEPDGKWGTDSYIAALGFDPNAPPGCHPRPAWWASAGRSNCNRVIVEASKALTEMEAWKRAREGSGTMSGISLNGAYIP